MRWQAPTEADRRHGRSWAAEESAREARAVKRLAKSSSRASHAALDRREAEDRHPGGGAQRALPAAGRSGAQGRRAAHSDRAHARRSGRNGAVSAWRAGAGVAGLPDARGGARCRIASARASRRWCPPAARPSPKSRLSRRCAPPEFPSPTIPQPRSALHPAAAARLMPGLAARRARCARGSRAGAPDGAGRPGDRAGGRRGAAARSAPRMAGAGAGRLRAADLPICRPKSRCGCSAGRSRHAGDEGPVELGKLEALYAALAPQASPRPRAGVSAAPSPARW